MININNNYHLSNIMPEESEIEQLRIEIGQLRKELNRKVKLLKELRAKQNINKEEPNPYCYNLSSEETVRYSRQTLIEDIGVSGQLKLKKSKVLIVGAGGLGCPSALYLTTAGIGEITIVDFDEVELSNLHRQVLHSEEDIGVAKVQSAYATLKSINNNVHIIPLKTHADSKTIKEIVAKNIFDVVVDGSDNVATRYLLNDVCVLNNIPLVSGSALQMEGQLTVYNYKGGPCYRCLFPVPPPPNTVTSCGDGGVLGVVPGTIGVLQALETIKIIIGSPGVLSSRLLLFDASTTTFRNIKLRNKNAQCAVCGENPSVTHLIDYEQFCASGAHDKVKNIDILSPTEQINVEELANDSNNTKIVLDVRPKIEYQMCKLPDSFNFPYSNIENKRDLGVLTDIFRQRLKDTDSLNVFVVCRRGNDSQRAVSALKNIFSSPFINYINVRGGLHAYSSKIDSRFPVY